MSSELTNVPREQWPSELVVLSAPDLNGLLARIDGLLRDLQVRGEPLAALASELFRKPREMQRLAVVASGAEELAAKLDQMRRRLAASPPARLRLRGGAVYVDGSRVRPGRLAVLFPGQGSQHLGMLHDLSRTFPRVRRWFESLDEAVSLDGEPVPSSFLQPPDGLSDEERLRRGRALLSLTGGAQAGMVANLACYEFLHDLGVTPDFMAGHSNGEHAALVTSGHFRFDHPDGLFEALRRIAEVARRLPPPPAPEAMIAVAAVSPERIDRMVESSRGRLFLAMENGPRQIVLAGWKDAVDAASESLVAEGGVCAVLPFDRAYHTPLFRRWTDEMRLAYDTVAAAPGRIPLFSCLTTAPFPADPAAVRDLAARQWSSPVRFRQTIEALYEDGARIFIEAGPNNKLTALVTGILRGREHLAVSTSDQVRSGLEPLQRMAGELYAHGAGIDLTAFNRWGSEAREEAPGPAPALTLVREHFELMQEFLASQSRVLALLGGGSAPPAAPLLGEPQRVGRDLHWERRYEVSRDPWVLDHALGRILPVLPFTLSLEVLAEAAQSLAGGTPVAVEDVRAQRWLALDRGFLDLSVNAEPLPDGRVRVQAFASGPAVEGAVRLAPCLPPPPLPAIAARSGRPPREWTPARFYRDYAFHGPWLQGMEEIRSLEEGEIEAVLRTTACPGIPEGFAVDPALLDCAGQLVALWLLESDVRDFGIFPFSLDSLEIFQPPPSPGTRVACRGRARLIGAGTESDFEFVAPEGRLLARLSGLRQRLVRFPPGFSLGAGLIPPDLPPAFLEESWGIWGRTLAHRVLSVEELDAWYALPEADRAASLIEHIAGSSGTFIVPKPHLESER